VHGQNVVHGPFRAEDGSLKVNELFYTIQGEGPDQGRPAIFLRLSHCNLRCFFCDTEFEKGAVFTQQLVVDDVLILASRHHCNLVVITGGEPLLQNIAPLVKDLNRCGLSVSVETAGTTWFEELDELFSPVRAINNNLIVCSPKTPKVHPELEKLVGAWKYIIKAGPMEQGAGGIPSKSTQREGEIQQLFLPRDVSVPIWVQPMDEGELEANTRNLMAARDISLKFGYRLGVQVHKLAGLR
jgi:7-carboxy-7-deazaguanine synthase